MEVGKEVIFQQNPNDPNVVDMHLKFKATKKQREAFRYWYDEVTTEI